MIATDNCAAIIFGVGDVLLVASTGLVVRRDEAPSPDSPGQLARWLERHLDNVIDEVDHVVVWPGNANGALLTDPHWRYAVSEVYDRLVRAVRRGEVMRVASPPMLSPHIGIDLRHVDVATAKRLLNGAIRYARIDDVRRAVPALAARSV